MVNKYNARGLTVDGIRFDSQAEYARYVDLQLMARRGEITDIRHHVIYPLRLNGVPLCKYEADFVYQKEGVFIVEDVKSKATCTPVYRLKKQLMLALHQIAIQEVFQ